MPAAGDRRKLRPPAAGMQVTPPRSRRRERLAETVAGIPNARHRSHPDRRSLATNRSCPERAPDARRRRPSQAPAPGGGNAGDAPSLTPSGETRGDGRRDTERPPPLAPRPAFAGDEPLLSRTCARCPPPETVASSGPRRRESAEAARAGGTLRATPVPSKHNAIMRHSGAPASTRARASPGYAALLSHNGSLCFVASRTGSGQGSQPRRGAPKGGREPALTRGDLRPSPVAPGGRIPPVLRSPRSSPATSPAPGLASGALAGV